MSSNILCPKCGGSLKEEGDVLKCQNCGAIYREMHDAKQDAYRSLLDDIRSGTSKRYVPAVDFEHGVHYPELKADINGQVDSFISSLEKVGALIPEIWDNLVICPECGTHKLFIQLRCPSCGSGKLKRESLIHHLSCGHFDVEEAFIKGDKYVCPKCNGVLKALGVDYRRAEKVYKCFDCGVETPMPKVKYVCVRGHEFFDDEFVLREIKLYKVDPSKKFEIEALLDVIPLLKVLSSRGMRVEAPISIISAYGVKFNFSFAAWPKDVEEGNGPLILGDILISDGPVGVEPVLMFKSKSEHINHKYAVLIAIPEFDESARELAKSYGFFVLEVKSFEMLEQKVDEFLERVMSTIDERERFSEDGV